MENKMINEHKGNLIAKAVTTYLMDCNASNEDEIDIALLDLRSYINNTLIKHYNNKMCKQKPNLRLVG